jgi:hypothetical protein
MPFTFPLSATVAQSKMQFSRGGFFRREAGSMRKSSSAGHAGQAIERILELSADAHIARRTTVKDSPAFHNLTEVIAACGNALAFLTAHQQQEEFYAVIGECEFSECAAAI